MDVPSRSKPEPQPGLTFVHPPRTDHPFMGVHVSGSKPFWWQTGVLPLHVSRPPADNYCVIGHNLKGAWLPVAVPTGQTCHLQLFFLHFLSSTNYIKRTKITTQKLFLVKNTFFSCLCHIPTMPSIRCAKGYDTSLHKQTLFLFLPL